MRPLHLYVATILIWGSTWYAIKMQLGSVEPLASVTYRFILAAMILMGWCHFRALPLRFDLRSHAGMMLLGLFLFSTNYAVFYYATGYVTTGLVAMVFSTIIIMNIVGGAIFLSNRITRTVAAGALTGTVGIFLVFLPDLDTINGFGIMLCLLGTVLASAGNLISASNQRRGIPVVQANAWGMTYGALFLTVTLASSGVPVTFEWSIGYVTSLVYLALFGSVVAFGCYLTLIGRVGPERAAYATVLFPIVALLISTVLEDYHWSTTSIAGALLVLAGNFLVTRRKPVPRDTVASPSR